MGIPGGHPAPHVSASPSGRPRDGGKASLFPTEQDLASSASSPGHFPRKHSSSSGGRAPGPWWGQGRVVGWWAGGSRLSNHLDETAWFPLCKPRVPGPSRWSEDSLHPTEAAAGPAQAWNPFPSRLRGRPGHPEHPAGRAENTDRRCCRPSPGLPGAPMPRPSPALRSRKPGHWWA